MYSSRSITPYNDDGSLSFLRRNYAPFNILHEIEHNSLDLDISDIQFQTNLNYVINDNLNITTTLYGRWYKSKALQSIHENSNNAEAYRADDPLIRNSNIFLFDDPASPELEPYSILPNGGFRKTTENTLTSYSMKNALNYSPKMGADHNVALLLGQEVRYTDRGQDYFEGWGYVFEKGGLIISDPNFIRYLDDRGEDYFDVEDTRNRYWGTFTNAAYSYKSRYTVNSTFTYAGDNRTGKSTKARYLPTFNVSAAWNIQNESWMENVDWVNSLKLKSTYGISGDNPINASAALSLLGAEPLRPHLTDRETALIIDNLENSELTFEKLYEFNVGLEAGFLNNRIYSEIEYYKRQSKDLLGLIETNGVGGIQYKYGNIGEMDLEGFELSLNTVNVETQNFKWTTNLTFNTTKNEITKWESRDRIGDAISRYGANLVGYPKGALFSVPFAGLDSNGVPTFYDEDGGITQELNLQERDDITKYLKYEGSTTPKGFGGFSNSFTYKNVNLSFGFVYRYGNKIRLDDAFYGNYDDYSSLPGDLINRWSFPGDENITNIPAIITPLVDKYLSDNSLNPYELYNKSDLRVADGDFVRLKSLKIAYKLPQELLKNTRLTGVTASISGYNLWLLYSDDKLNGVDPEFFQSGGVSLPLTKSYTFALNFNF